MKLHLDSEAFNDLVPIVSRFKNIPESAIRRDYLIVFILKQLSNSPYSELCVFKGGTSLSKGYPGSIERFSEDINLTYLEQDASDKRISKEIKKIEEILSQGLESKPIPRERSNRSKSSYIWMDNEQEGIKLEIGSSVRPDPYQKKYITTYIQEYLEIQGMTELVSEYELSPVEVNVLDITRTFLDKVLAVKRHALSQTLRGKARHIYDVVRLYSRPDVQVFLSDVATFKNLLQLTKQTDYFYLEKRQSLTQYNPKEAYAFELWIKEFCQPDIVDAYESLHVELLYTSERQVFDEAVTVFQSLSQQLQNIGE